ncbi:hypothetical protein PDE_09634 [Penicillium oxalicum 114-2]|uniref:Ubiquitin interaction motif protein n=1 Tax=Penicillium oxalicum (strain 114-2 / CGMCC 5302) TaxID=933388 RepID=S7ZV96_PENO1|nr:hypothetical protein PDE_09634 [Penicillium oxalicum 114-2]
MTTAPPEDAIANFVSFTSTTREQAILFLKANNLDSQKAINAYFEDPTGSQLKTSDFADENLSPLGYSHQEYGSRVPATAPPSRPPSRVNTPGTADATRTENSPAGATQDLGSGPGLSGSGLTLAEREEQQLQQAVAMSLGQGIGQQETGVTKTTEKNHQANFGKATRDYYDEADWGMTLFNETAQELVVDPEPEDRVKVEGEPAFLRPTSDKAHLAGYLTILHEIPLAREALLLRNKMLFDYGGDAQWWNGHSIYLPKIVTVHDREFNYDDEWEDIIYESQRLMAFLDSTKRAYGSADALAKLKDVDVLSSEPDEIIARFLEIWHASAIRAAPDSPLATAFMSHAYKRSPFDEGDETVSRELFVFEPIIEQETDQTLYDVLDTAIWSDLPGEQLDDVWLEHVGDIVTMKLDAFNGGTSVNVKIPAVFYPDRYLSSCRELARELRTKRLVVQEEIHRLTGLIERYTKPQSTVANMGLKELLEKAAAATAVALAGNRDNDTELVEVETATEKSARISKELLAISQRIDSKLQELEAQKKKAMETLRSYSKTLTEAPEAPGEPPLSRYSLRGVCTKPHITYVLKRADNRNGGDLMELGAEQQASTGDQWWRISYSTEDGKTQQQAKQKGQETATAAQSGDVMGYTVTKVREIEVLRAAREEWKSVLLVYASDAAVNAPVDPAPTQLRGFVEKDNEAFAKELEESTANSSAATTGQLPAESKNATQQQQQRPSNKPPPPPPRPTQQVNVFDYQVSNFGNDSDYEQEMKEKEGPGLLGAKGGEQTGDLSHALDDDVVWNVDGGDTQMSDHVEHVGGNPSQAS